MNQAKGAALADPGGLLRRMFDAAVASADPGIVLARHLPDRPTGRCIVIGAGKAAAGMAAAVEQAWPEVPLTGAVVVPYGTRYVAGRVAVLEAAHPVPDANSEAAARRMLALVEGLSADDLVVALISGGGSSLMALPVAGITLAEKQALNRALLASGLDIRVMNALRRRVSAVKGGKLAAAASPARVVTLAISDIPGDDPAAIASGPTVPPGQEPDIQDALCRLQTELPAGLLRHLNEPEVPIAAATDVRLIATPGMALAAAADVAATQGIAVRNLGDALEGDSRALARHIAALATEPVDVPTVLLSGGETSVEITSGGGRGGRNTEFLLALVDALDSRPGVWALAADTDGVDGGAGAAGAVAGPDTIERALALGLDRRDFLARHDSAGFFEALGDLVATGPTGTNVNDFRAVLVLPPGQSIG